MILFFFATSASLSNAQATCDVGACFESDIDTVTLLQVGAPMLEQMSAVTGKSAATGKGPATAEKDDTGNDDSQMLEQKFAATVKRAATGNETATAEKDDTGNDDSQMLVKDSDGRSPDSTRKKCNSFPGDVKGPKIKVLTVDHAYACKKECEWNAQCQCYAFDAQRGSNTNVCWLKHEPCGEPSSWGESGDMTSGTCEIVEYNTFYYWLYYGGTW